MGWISLDSMFTSFKVKISSFFHWYSLLCFDYFFYIFKLDSRFCFLFYGRMRSYPLNNPWSFYFVNYWSKNQKLSINFLFFYKDDYSLHLWLHNHHWSSYNSSINLCNDQIFCIICRLSPLNMPIRLLWFDLLSRYYSICINKNLLFKRSQHFLKIIKFDMSLTWFDIFWTFGLLNMDRLDISPFSKYGIQYLFCYLEYELIVYVKWKIVNPELEFLDISSTSINVIEVHEPFYVNFYIQPKLEVIFMIKSNWYKNDFG